MNAPMISQQSRSLAALPVLVDSCLAEKGRCYRLLSHRKHVRRHSMHKIDYASGGKTPDVVQDG